NVKEIMDLEIMRSESELATRKRQTSLRRKESFTKKGSRMVIQDTQIMLWRKERALLKLLLCEEDLLNVLLVGNERFILPLRKRCTLATPAELDILFGNIEEVGTIHEKNVQQLRQLTQGTDDNVGRLYQKQVDDRLSVLRKYVSGLSLARILLRLKIVNKPFKDFIEESKKAEENTDLLFLIEKPLKYISDLTSQLATLLASTAVGHNDYVCLESVVSIYRTFENEMLEVMAKLSNFEDLENLETAFDGEEPYPNLEFLQEKTLFTRGPKGFSLLSPGRYWLFSGQLAKIEGRHYTMYWALLLSDCLIFARRTEQGVLLVLDEPIMLRSIYQITFDVKKCDTEFRILFAVEPFQRSSGQRHQWTTWILRAPCSGIKLIWQYLLSHQLSLYSTQALVEGKDPSFVHVKQSLLLKGILPKRNSRYEESSFTNIVQGPCAMYVKHAISKPNNEGPEDIDSADKQGQPLDNPSYDNPVLRKIRLDKYGKAGGSFKESKKKPVTRSKSFGNDFADSIPFIDCAEESNSGTESNIVYVREYKEFEPKTDGTEVLKTPYKDGYDSKYELSSSISCYYSDPGTPRLAKTDDSADSCEGSTGKRTPKKKFPRLGTFERIKLENRSATLQSPSKVCRTRTGTSAKHRRQAVASTVSKEPLLKSDSVSPVHDLPAEIKASSTPEKTPRKVKKGFFSRLFKIGSSNASSIDSVKMEDGIREDPQADITEMEERKVFTREMEKVETACNEEDDQPPPDYETTLKMKENVQVRFYVY
ncbi:hypothetical protein JTE90_002727, partial [Oedothorax gibbosus]